MDVSNTQTRSCIGAIFDDRYQAEQAVDDLAQSGFKPSEIGFAIRGSDAIEGGTITDAVGTKDGQGAVTGLIGGGFIGGLLGAAAALIVPGVGPILAAGVLWTALGGAAAGAATGGILGALAGLGISEEEALFYEKALKRGKAVVTVQAGSRCDEAASILRRHGAREIPSRPFISDSASDIGNQPSQNSPQSR